MTDKEINDVVERLRAEYNAPPPTPREEMWATIRQAVAVSEAPSGDVVDLAAVRAQRRQALHRPLGWAVAAAAVLVMGIGIGRMTAPVAPTTATEGVPNSSVLHAAAVEHLDRTGALLTLVRADARSGSVDPRVGAWARGLLIETRLFLDAPGETDPALRDLMEDLELVLAQVVSVTELDDTEGPEARTELGLALQGLEDREVLTRIQAVSGPALAGT